MTDVPGIGCEQATRPDGNGANGVTELLDVNGTYQPLRPAGLVKPLTKIQDVFVQIPAKGAGGGDGGGGDAVSPTRGAARRSASSTAYSAMARIAASQPEAERRGAGVACFVHLSVSRREVRQQALRVSLNEPQQKPELCEGHALVPRAPAGTLAPLGQGRGVQAFSTHASRAAGHPPRRVAAVLVPATAGSGFPHRPR